MNQIYNSMLFTALSNTKILFISFLICGSFNLFGQNSCNYILTLNDSFGDGWNGAQLAVTIDGVTTIYTLDDINDDGFTNSFQIAITEGQSIILEYSPGSFEGEVTYSLIDAEGGLLFSDGPDPAVGEVYNDIGMCPSCPQVTDIVVDMVTASSGDLSWNGPANAVDYIIEYGPFGFEPGSGTILNSSTPNISITDLIEATIYEVYVQVNCGSTDGLSLLTGPISFITEFLNPPATCFYTLELNDSFGDGWNGSLLTVTINGVTTTYTLDNINDDGEFNAFQVEVLDGIPVMIEYSPGNFENEVTYSFLDPEGTVIFSDGPDPAIGQVFFEPVECPTCNLASNFVLDGVTTNSADLSWTGQPNAVSYNIEYGPFGFELGTGTVINIMDTNVTIPGLEEATVYDVYVQVDCGEMDSLSNYVGPVTVLTDFTELPGSCNYILELNDSFGDGWNGSVLTITIAGVSTTYTLDNINDDGSFNSFEVAVPDGFPVLLEYEAGAFQGEVSYTFSDPEGFIVFADGPNPATGQVFFAPLQCPNCPVPTDITIDDAGGLFADISWTPGDSSGIIIVQYGPAGMPVDSFLVDTIVGGNAYTITGLEENTAYEFYIYGSCDNGDISTFQGPISFETIYQNDVGLAAVTGPLTACGLGTETVTVALTNHGEFPQSLVPFRYSVNGVDAGVPVPLDGFFTDIVGTADTAYLEFETMFDFSEPGVYVIAAWTEMEMDSDNSNDTAFLTIVNIPVLSNFPYVQNFEEWNGGWAVDEISELPTWEFGTPQNIFINGAASGENAWVTGLEGDYNNNELSYLVSPCFDFSDVMEDPIFRFSINYDTELTWDGCWLEGSIDGEETWTKIGTVDSGVNWYNFTNTNTGIGDVWAGQSDGWITAEHVLEGYMGESDCRFRFVFDSDGSVSNEGIGIDDIFVSPPLANDLSAESAEHLVLSGCGAIEDSIRINIRNAGTQPQTGFDVFYQVNNDPPVMENIGAVTLEPNESIDYTFSTPFNSNSFSTTFNIKAWVAAVGEQNEINDSTDFSFTTLTPDVLPLIADFEDNLLPAGWTADGIIGQAHNSPSVVIYDNLWTGDLSFDVNIPVIGPINPGDSLTFDYRYVDFSAGTEGTVLGDGDTLWVQISTDCGNSFITEMTINADNHVPTPNMANRTIDLDNYAGEYINIRFFAVRGTGDYYLDLDNINILGCPESLLLEPTFIFESMEGAEDGAIMVNPLQGIGPYTYDWEVSGVGNTIINVGAGTYSVTVTDGNGCVDEGTFEVGICPESLGIESSVTDETDTGTLDGSIDVIPTGGEGPYTFEWSNGETTSTITNLESGDYEVTVSDVNNCSEVLQFFVGLTTSLYEIDNLSTIALRPNPTTGQSILDLRFTAPVDVEVQVLNALSQVLLSEKQDRTQLAQYLLDLTSYSSGMYFVRIQVGNQIQIERLVKMR